MKKLLLSIALLSAINIQAKTPEEWNQQANYLFELFYTVGFMHALEDSYFGAEHFCKQKGISYEIGELMAYNHSEYLTLLPYLDPTKILRNINSKDDIFKWTLGKKFDREVATSFCINFVMAGYKSGARAVNEEELLLSLPDELLFQKCRLIYARILQTLH